MSYNYDDDAPVNQYPVSKVPDMFGGYMLMAITDDGDTLCEFCVIDPTNPVWESSPLASDGDGWGVVGWDSSASTDEGYNCAHCNRVLSEAWDGE